jgi:hypothetical protein
VFFCYAIIVKCNFKYIYVLLYIVDFLATALFLCVCLLLLNIFKIIAKDFLSYLLFIASTGSFFAIFLTGKKLATSAINKNLKEIWREYNAWIRQIVGEYENVPLPSQGLYVGYFEHRIVNSLGITLENIDKYLIADNTSLYSARHTFATICQQYVRPDIVDIWMGDSTTRLVGKVYTHFPDKFMLENMMKVEFPKAENESKALLHGGPFLCCFFYHP